MIVLTSQKGIKWNSVHYSPFVTPELISKWSKLNMILHNWPINVFIFAFSLLEGKDGGRDKLLLASQVSSVYLSDCTRYNPKLPNGGLCVCVRVGSLVSLSYPQPPSKECMP